MDYCRQREDGAGRLDHRFHGWVVQARKKHVQGSGQVGGRGWRCLKPILLYLKGVSNKSYLISLTTMSGPTGASKIALEGEKRVYG